MIDKDTAVQLLTKEAKLFEKIKREGRKVDMSRGKPCAAQLNSVMGLFDEFSSAVEIDGADFRNYGGVEGVPALRKLFGEILGVPAEQVIATSSGSLSMMYDMLQRAMQYGLRGGKPWRASESKPKFLCPAPGYDRHFEITRHLGIEMITVPMKHDGPDMDIVEQLAASCESIKGIWCVPKYSNPTGATYSDEVVDRLAKMQCAARDFVVMWDNAYCLHGLTELDVPLKNIAEACAAAGNPDRVFMFTSTAKILFPGGACSCLAASKANIDDCVKHISIQQINPNKVWQTMTAAYLKDMNTLTEIMALHRKILKPKFDIVEKVFKNELGDWDIGASWTTPKGGYFVSLDVMPRTAKRVWELCKSAGLTLTASGATFPYGVDDNDSNLRIAPTFPELDELMLAMRILACCVRLAAAEQLLRE